MVGIFIGSFNPPTLAHLEIALKLKNRYEKVVFVPVNTRYKHLLSMEDRVNMLRIYGIKYPFIEISNIMEKYSYLNYRIVDILKRDYSNIELIIGADLLDDLVNFDNYIYLLENYHFLVVTRNKIDTKKIIKDMYFKYQDKFTILNYSSGISSSMAREYLREKKSVATILDKDIYMYIKNKGIYF